MHHTENGKEIPSDEGCWGFYLQDSKKIMKATITKVTNGYTTEIDGHTYVGMNVNDIMKILIQEPSSIVYNTINKEGESCQVTFVVTTKNEHENEQN